MLATPVGMGSKPVQKDVVEVLRQNNVYSCDWMTVSLRICDPHEVARLQRDGLQVGEERFNLSFTCQQVPLHDMIAMKQHYEMKLREQRIFMQQQVSHMQQQVKQQAIHIQQLKFLLFNNCHVDQLSHMLMTDIV
jgi:hypothetical protein